MCLIWLSASVQSLVSFLGFAYHGNGTREGKNDALHKSLHAMRVLTTTFTVPFPVASGIQTFPS